MSGLRCPATHAYAPHGKVLVCRQCADVQPIVLEEPPAGTPRRSRTSRLQRAAPPPGEGADPSPEEMDNHIRLLREAANLAGAQTELPLGTRQVYTDNMDTDAEALIRQSNERTVPRVPVDDAEDDALPDAGV